MRCSQCGAGNRDAATFCDSCGATLHGEGPSFVKSGTERAFGVGERRHLTVLFCDLVGSTEIAARLDPEEWREILASYHLAVTEAIHRLGGYVAQYLGDGVMAYFGWPEAHDNNAERAVRAGLGIIEAVAQLNEQAARPKLSARIGIDSGAVVVGAGIGSKTDVFGDAPNVAARVQAAALPNTVLITTDTHRLISGLFVVEDRGKHTVKGFEQPLHLYRVIRPSDVQGRLQAMAAVRALTPFIGRNDELRLLMDRWEQALGGEAQVVLVRGEGGIGKSRLLQHFHRQIAGRPYKWVEGVASPFFQNTAFYPTAGIFQELGASHLRNAGLARDTAPQRGTKRTVPNAKESNGHSGNGALRVNQEQQGLSVPAQQLDLTPQLAAAIVALKGLSIVTGRATSGLLPREQLLAILVESVLSVAQLVPLVFVIEDLHWADPSTLELLQLLAEKAKSVPLMLLYTARPEFRDQSLPQRNYTQITLDALSTHNARTMVELLAAQQVLTEETITTVVERTGGVPLFIEELTRAAIESAGIVSAGCVVPATLHDSLMARLDRLGAARETLQLGAVLGIEFTYDLLCAVSPLDQEELRRHLLVLTDAGLLYEHGLPPEATYQFKHALIRDAAYETLLRSRRRELHTRIAETIEERFSERAASRPEILAYHCSEAGLISQAVRYWRKAGRKASERSANLEAIAQLRKGLDLLNMLPNSSERLLEEVKLQIALTTPLIATVGYTATEVEKAANRALDLCQQVGNGPQLFNALGSLNSIYFNRGELGIALELAKQMLRIAQTQHNPALLMWAHYAMGFALASSGKFTSAREHLERSIARYEPRRAGNYAYVQDPGPTAMALLSQVVHSLGYPDRALNQLHKAIALARSLSHAFTLAWVLGAAGQVHWARGDKSKAEECWREKAAISAEHGFKPMLESASFCLGFALAEREGEAGIVKMQEIYARSSSTGALFGDKIRCLGMIGLALGRAGQTAEGIARIDEALGIEKTITKLPDLCDLNFFKGQLYLMQKPSGIRKARQCFSVSIQIAREMGAKADELTAVMEMAKLMAGQGRRHQAHSMIKKIYNWFTEGFDIADLKEAKALIEELTA